MERYTKLNKDIERSNVSNCDIRFCNTYNADDCKLNIPTWNPVVHNVIDHTAIYLSEIRRSTVIDHKKLSGSKIYMYNYLLAMDRHNEWYNR